MANASAFGFSGYDPIGSFKENALNSAFAQGNSYLSSANSFAWNGKDLRRNVRYQKKLMRFQQQMNQQNARWNALNMPSFNKQGLQDAGINPLLAYGSINSGGAGEVAVPAGPADTSYEPGQSYQSSATNGFDAEQFFKGKNGRKLGEATLNMAQANATKAAAEAHSAVAKADADAEDDWTRKVIGRIRNEAMFAAEPGDDGYEGRYEDYLNRFVTPHDVSTKVSWKKAMEQYNYERDKFDRDVYMNSALRAKMLDGRDTLVEGVKAVSGLKKPKVIHKK